MCSLKITHSDFSITFADRHFLIKTGIRNEFPFLFFVRTEGLQLNPSKLIK